MISQRLTQASLPIFPPHQRFYLQPCVSFHLHLATTQFSTWQPLLALLISLPGKFLFIIEISPALGSLPCSPISTSSTLSYWYCLPRLHAPIHPSYSYVLTISLCQTGTSMLHLSCTGLPVWINLFEVRVGLRHVCASSTQRRVQDGVGAWQLFDQIK